MANYRDRAAAARDPDLDFLLGDPDPPLSTVAPIDPGPFNREAVERIRYFIIEREAMRLRREAGQPPPWSSDPNLRDWRYTNVFRQHDKESRYITEVWHGDDELLASPAQIVANAVLARLVNWTPTLEELRGAGINRQFDADKARRILRARFERGDKVESAAYKISPVIGIDHKWDSVPGQVEEVFRRGAGVLDTTSMRRTWEGLMALRVPGVGGFYAGQAVADLRYALRGTWADRHTWAPMGPGSQRGIAWVKGWDGKDKARAEKLAPKETFLRDLLMMWDVLHRIAPVRDVLDGLGAELFDLQNVLCETDKLSRLVTGTGKPKCEYPPKPKAKAKRRSGGS